MRARPVRPAPPAAEARPGAPERRATPATGGAASGYRRDVGQRGLERRLRLGCGHDGRRRRRHERRRGPRRDDRHRGHRRRQRHAGRGGTTGTAGTGGAAGRGGRPAPQARRGAAGRGGTTGTAGTGGTTGAAGASGTTGSGGSGPTQCTLQNHSGNGSFTWYYFGQGTARDGNGYRTACGYYGTENGQTDTIENIASMSPASATYFAAIPGQNGFDSKSHCGECVQITGQNGTVIIATVIDECPYGSDGGNSACAANAGGHLDLSKPAFDRLGYSVGNPSGTNWKFIPCPVSGNVKVRFKSGNNNEFFVENVITPIASVSVNGTSASRQSYGAWHVGSRSRRPRR